MSQAFELNSNESDVPFLILGIDPGTTGAKVAFLRASETYDGDKIEVSVDPRDKVYVIGNFPGHRQSEMSTLPTCLLYDEFGKLAHWGHDAVRFQSKYNIDPRRLIANWKIKLLEGSMQNSLGKPPQEFTTDFFRALSNHLFCGPRSALLSHFGGLAKMRKFAFLDLVIAIPPGWSHEEHTLFTDAAREALEKVPKVRISFVSETECALRSWQSQEGRYGKVKDGEVVVLMDLGGGTACLSGFRYEGEDWAHLESYSLRAGSEVASAAFQRDFTTRLRQARLPETNTILHCALKEFDIRKKEIGTEDEEDIWLCPVQGLRYSEQYAFRDGHMIFTREQLRNYFQPLQNGIFEKLDDMVTRIEPKCCVLVGAYARNELFLNELDIRNKRYGMRIFQPEKQAEAVATGACHTRVDGDCRLVHGSRISVGIMTFKLWNDVKKYNPGAHHFQLDGDRNSWWCRVITWIVKKGAIADQNRAIIDHDGNTLRRRNLLSEDDFIINESILTMEASPGDEKFTVLTYGTDDGGWQKNKQEFKERFNVPLIVRSLKLDLTYQLVQNKDMSKVIMKNANFRRDVVGKYFEYKYYLNYSQTDCRMSLEVFSRTGKTAKILLQDSILAFEAESKELHHEQQFAKQLSQSYGVSSAYEGADVRTHLNFQQPRVGSPRGIAAEQNARGVLRNGGEALTDEDLFAALSAEDSLHTRQAVNMLPPIYSSPYPVPHTSAASPGNQSNANLNPPDAESENWIIAENALKSINWPSQEERSPFAFEGYDTPSLRSSAVADNGTEGYAYATSTSGSQHASIMPSFITSPSNESNLEYHPREKVPRKCNTPLSRGPKPKSKRIRTK